MAKGRVRDDCTLQLTTGRIRLASVKGNPESRADLWEGAVWEQLTGSFLSNSQGEIFTWPMAVLAWRQHWGLGWRYIHECPCVQIDW